VNASRNEAGEVLAIVAEQTVCRVGDGSSVAFDRVWLVGDPAKHTPGIGVLEPVGPDIWWTLMNNDGVYSVGIGHIEPIADVEDAVVIDALFVRPLRDEIKPVGIVLIRHRNPSCLGLEHQTFLNLPFLPLSLMSPSGAILRASLSAFSLCIRHDAGAFGMGFLDTPPAVATRFDDIFIMHGHDLHSFAIKGPPIIHRGQTERFQGAYGMLPGRRRGASGNGMRVTLSIRRSFEICTEHCAAPEPLCAAQCDLREYSAASCKCRARVKLREGNSS
jgi:hypothetical protein